MIETSNPINASDFSASILIGYVECRFSMQKWAQITRFNVTIVYFWHLLTIPRPKIHMDPETGGLETEILWTEIIFSVHTSSSTYFHHKMPWNKNSDHHRYQWKDSQQLGCVASAWCLVELPHWHVLDLDIGEILWKESLDPTNRNSGKLSFSWFCINPELGVFACQPESISFWNFCVKKMERFPMYFGKKGTKRNWWISSPISVPLCRQAWVYPNIGREHW